MKVHDHITDWQHLPSSFLAGKRAIATTVEGTTIDGFLQSMTTKFSNGSGSMVQLFFGGVFQPVIISLNGGENQLCRAYDSILILNEVKRWITNTRSASVISTPCRMRHSMDMNWSYGIGT